MSFRSENLYFTMYPRTGATANVVYRLDRIGDVCGQVSVCRLVSVVVSMLTSFVLLLLFALVPNSPALVRLAHRIALVAALIAIAIQLRFFKSSLFCLSF